MTDKGKPEPGKQYRLTGKKSIAAGNTWAESEVEQEVTLKFPNFPPIKGAGPPIIEQKVLYKEIDGEWIEVATATYKEGDNK